jgi:plasmid stabilization system protein ParE
MEIVWRRAALKDLRPIHECIAQDNPRAATRVHGAIRATVGPLNDHPNLGRAGRVEGTRRWSSVCYAGLMRDPQETQPYPKVPKCWLGREDSNLRMTESKSVALPLGYAPTDIPAGCHAGLLVLPETADHLPGTLPGSPPRRRVEPQMAYRHPERYVAGRRTGREVTYVGRHLKDFAGTFPGLLPR